MKRTSILEKLPTLISIFSALVLTFSIVYDYGFFYILGVNFSEMPTTLSDHVRSSLTWIPNTMAMIFCVYVLELFNRRVEQGMTEDEIIQSSPMPKFTAWFRKSPNYLIIAVAIFVPITFFLDIELPLQAWQFSLIIIWFLMHNFFYSHERIRRETTLELYLVNRWLPAAIFFIAFQGAISANSIKSGVGNKYVFKLEKELVSGLLARSYDRSYLLWDKQKNEIKLLSSGKVISFKPKEKTESNE